MQLFSEPTFFPVWVESPGLCEDEAFSSLTLIADQDAHDILIWSLQVNVTPCNLPHGAINKTNSATRWGIFKQDEGLSVFDKGMGLHVHLCGHKMHPLCLEGYLWGSHNPSLCTKLLELKSKMTFGVRLETGEIGHPFIRLRKLGSTAVPLSKLKRSDLVCLFKDLADLWRMRRSLISNPSNLYSLTPGMERQE